MNHDPSSTADLQKLDRATILHPFTELKRFSSGEAGEPRIIAGGEGIRVRDRDGNELLDAFAGRYCVNVGYGRREIADAIHRQALELPYYPAYAGYSTEPAIHLAERVLAMTPGRMQRIYYGLSGSDANETQLKIVWYYNNVTPACVLYRARLGNHSGAGRAEKLAILTGRDLELAQKTPAQQLRT
jgi:L-2,4-diaminobutyrate transaminase